MKKSKFRSSPIFVSLDECEKINDFYFNLASGESAKFGQGKISAILYFSLIIIMIIDLVYNFFGGLFSFILIVASLLGGFFRYCAILYLKNENEETHQIKNYENLPYYTILIALYDEACVVPQLIKNLNLIEWPKEKLDIIFICEADDKETIEKLNKEINCDFMRCFVIADGQPRTKARALNVGFKYAKGEFLCIYDAEDEPHSKQLLEAYNIFKNSNPNLAVLQAPLITKNYQESFIAAQFTIDYAVWFRLLLPFIAKITGFIPLGGTSNHFRVDVLQKIGAWDPYNLTEDADLGVRIAKHGYFAKTISLPTIEEAPPKIEQWLKQRSRWIQGHLQTIGVHFSKPLMTCINLGFLKTIGIIIGIFLGPIFIILRLPILISQIYTNNFNTFNFYILLFFVLGLEIILNLIAIIRDRRYSLILHILFIPLYWALQAIAYFRATILLFTKPFKWEKTPHGSAARKQKDIKWI